MSDPTNELEKERKALARIEAAHATELARARRVAEGLASEAAEASEEGIRDLVDEDAEVDSAVRAALVRQTSDRAMHAARRAADLEARGAALAFGHITDEDDNRLYVGRLSVIEGEEPLLVDWRARASVPFYRATPLENMGINQRRHLHYRENASGEPSDLIDYSDELFDLDAVVDRFGSDDVALRGEAAILAAVNAPTAEHMRSVVATIQAEQDSVVRAPTDGPLVVQGGPGTGKTVVALHRAAYLLYDQREELADTGVLIVGPTSEFLRYIGDVLPSLGESGVVSVTANKLYAGILTGRPEDESVAEIKGRDDMVPLIRDAVLDRQRRPKKGLTVYYGSRRVDLSIDTVREFFDRSMRHRQHNDAAAEFRRLVVDALLAEVYDPSFVSADDARATFRKSRVVNAFLLRHVPSLTPERALNDLLGSHALLRSAARNTALTDDETKALWRDKAAEEEFDTIRWTNADVCLLDELLYRLGGSMGQTEDEQIRVRDAIDEFERAAQADEEVDLAMPMTERPDDEDDETDSVLYFSDPYFEQD